MLSGNGRHRRPRQAPAFVVTAGVTGAGIALPLLVAGTAAFAADGKTWDKVAECESDALWSADTGNGYFGGLQLTLEQWSEYGGGDYADRPDHASRGQQIAVGERILQDLGPKAFPGCADLSGLRQGAADPEIDPGQDFPDYAREDAEVAKRGAGGKHRGHESDTDTDGKGNGRGGNGNGNGNGKHRGDLDPAEGLDISGSVGDPDGRAGEHLPETGPPGRPGEDVRDDDDKVRPGDNQAEKHGSDDVTAPWNSMGRSLDQLPDTASDLIQPGQSRHTGRW